MTTINVCKSLNIIGGNIKNFCKAFSNNSSSKSNCSMYTLNSKYLKIYICTILMNESTSLRCILNKK